MSVHPAVGTKAVGTTKGTAQSIADLKRRIKVLESTPVAIADDSITGQAIAPLSITASEIAAGSINAQHIVTGTITALQIQAGTITANLIAAQTITANQIAANTITANQIASGTITANEIKAATITASLIQAGTINAQLIQAGAIDASHIKTKSLIADNIQAGTITAQEIKASTITGDLIAAGAITANQIAAGSVTADRITAGSITATQIAANTITANEVAATTLSSLWTTTGSLQGGTIIGGTFKTATSGSRVEIDSNGLRGYALDGVSKTFEVNTGTGAASFTGIALLDPNSTVPSRSLTGFIGGGNLLGDSSFESTDPAKPYGDFTTLSNVTITKSTAQAFHGTRSALLVPTAAGAFAYAQSALGGYHSAIKGRPIVFSAWVYIPSAAGTNTTGSTDALLIVNDGVTAVATNPTAGIARDTWVRVVQKFTVASSSTNVLFALVNPLTGATPGIYFDGVQVELGDAATAYSPKADEILYGSIRSEFIGAGEIKANNIQSGSITTDKIGFTLPSSGAPNRITNFSFEDSDPGQVTPPKGYSATVPAYWINSGATISRITTDSYDGGACASVSIAAGGAQYTGWAANNSDFVYKAGVTYTASLYAKSISGDTSHAFFFGQSNGANQNNVPVTLTSSWARYQVQWTPTADVPVGTSVYVGLRCVNSGTAYNYRVDGVQAIEGTTPGPLERKSGEILYGEVGPTLITPNSLTTNQIAAGQVHADRIQSGTIDALQIKANAITSAKIDAGAITADKVSFAPGNGNLLRDSSFEGVVSGGPWLFNGTLSFEVNATTGTVAGRGTKVARVTEAGSQGLTDVIQIIPAAPGNSYVASISIRLISGTPTNVQVYYQWRNAGTGTITTVGANVGSTLPVTSGWTRYVAPAYVAPAGAVDAVVYFRVTCAAGSGMQVAYDEAKVEIGDVATGWTQYINPTVIDGASVTGAVIQTKLGVGIGGVNGVVIDTNGLRGYATIAGVAGTKALDIPVSGNATFNGKLTAQGIDFLANTTAGGAGSVSSAKMAWYESNMTTQRGSIEVFNNGGLPYMQILSLRGNSGNVSNIQLAAEQQAGGYHQLILNANGILAINAITGLTTNIQNNVGQFAAPGDVVAGANLYTGPSSSYGIYVRGSGPTRRIWADAAGTLNLDGAFQTSGAVVGASGTFSGSMGAGSVVGGTLAVSGGSGYMQENYGIRFHTGVNGSNTIYGGWSSAHYVYAQSSAGNTYPSGYSFCIAHVDSSDRKFKTNIRDIYEDKTAAMARVRWLRPRKFDRALGGGQATDEIGFLAQEVEEIDPGLVMRWGKADNAPSVDDHATIHSLGLIALLVAAVQDADARIAALEAQLAVS